MKKSDKSRLHFGVVFPSLDNTEKYNLLQDIENFANEHDLHLTAYFGSYEVNNSGFASRYEPCFEDIKRNTALDGVIIYSGFIAHNAGTERFIGYVNSISNKLPVISIGLEIPGTYCVMSDNMSGMYCAVDHLIKVDGKTRIAFIKGPDGHPEAEERFSGYLKALSDNGIARDDNLILPGDFTPNGGRLAIRELIDKRRVTYDAIAACNDEGALGAMRELKDRGHLLPRDAAVIGFDDSVEAPTFKPPLSSVRQDFSKLGSIACDALIRVLNEEQTDGVIYVAGELIVRRSCGCNKKDRRKVVHHQDDRMTFERLRRTITDNLLLEFNLESLGRIIHDSLPIIALDFALIGVYHVSKTDTTDSDRSIELIFGFDGEEMIDVTDVSGTQFPFSVYSAIKGIDFEQKRRTIFFLPLFSGDEEIGSALIGYNNFNPVNWYESLRTNIAAAIKGAKLIETIQALSVTDELTGLLNRRGFFEQVHAKLRYLQREPDCIPVIFAVDMDGLKRINDTYGHAEGDIAITVFADLLRDSIRIGDIIGRIGGDEFIIHSVVKTEEDMVKLESRIRDNIDKYNAQNKHLYNVSGSIGTAMQSESTNDAFDAAMIEADNALYKEKQEKREKGLSRR